MWADAVSAFVTLLVIVDPVGLAPLFVALTRDMTPAERRRVALTGVGVAAGILAVFGLGGRALLDFLGISLGAFRISGGLLLFLIALEMVFERRTRRREEKTGPDDGPEQDPAVFPLATPLIAGPGAIATVMLLMSRHQGDWAGQAMVLGVSALVLGLVLAAFSVSGVIARLLGRTGVLVVTRLLGILLAALSVQFVLDGLAGLGIAPGGA